MAEQNKATVGTVAKEIKTENRQDKVNKKTVPNFDLAQFTGEYVDNKEEAIPPSPGLKNIYIPKWDNKPEPVPPIVSLLGTGILTHKNISTLIAKPGTGKSSIGEAVAASQLNPAGDNLGFSIAPESKGILFVDFERTDIDVWNSFYRICRRAGVSTGNDPDRFQIAGMRYVFDLKERMQYIEHLLSEFPCSLLILDGAGDLVRDPNDLQQAIDARTWMRDCINKYEISIFTTIHPNPNSNKPRGHLGSELLRESESIFLASPHPMNPNARIITSDFDFGKNRNNDKLTAGYMWSDNAKMFISCDLEETNNEVNRQKDAANLRKLQDLTDRVLPHLKSLSYTELYSKIMEEEGIKTDAAKKKVSAMKSAGLIDNSTDGLYRRKS